MLRLQHCKHWLYYASLRGRHISADRGTKADVGGINEKYKSRWDIPLWAQRLLLASSRHAGLELTDVDLRGVQKERWTVMRRSEPYRPFDMHSIRWSR